MSADIFIDTNILVYAHDRNAGARHARAQELVRAAWQGPGRPVVSAQVLQELFVTLTKRGVPMAEAEGVLKDYSCWRVVENTAEIALKAVEEARRWQVSYWDALILAAARSANAKTIWSEDLNDGQAYGCLRVVNPLKASDPNGTRVLKEHPVRYRAEGKRRTTHRTKAPNER